MTKLTTNQETLELLLTKMEDAKAAYINAYCDVLQFVKSSEAGAPGLIHDGVIYGKGVMQPVDLDDLYTRAMEPYAVKKTIESYGIERVSEWEA